MKNDMGDKMKFAYMCSRLDDENSIKQHINIGEYIQMYAVREALKTFGIDESEIVGIKESALNDYDGEEMILLLTNKYDICKISSKFHVVCIGYNKFGYDINDLNEINELGNYSLVGARDENTYSQLRKLGVNSYINGCISITLPKKQGPLGDNTYIVDVPVELLNYLPVDIKKSAIVKTHEYYFGNRMTEEELWDFSLSQYREYYENAKLVITSRLHLAAPCIAWGIPVILIRKNPFITFSWIDRYIPIYTPAMYSRIDWNPSAVDIEKDKRIILRDVSRLLFNEYYLYIDELDTHRMYLDRKYRPEKGYFKTIIEGMISNIERELGHNQSFNYIIWGMTQNANLLYNYMLEKFPGATCTDVIDTFKRVDFNGLISVPPEEVNYTGKIVFVIPVSAVQMAMNFLKDKELCKVYYATEMFITEEDLNNEMD